jgi:HSP20 family molecular chaperone IbpA
MHFVLPGHNHKTVDVAKRDRNIIIKSKELNKDDADYSSTSYYFYKSIPLIKKSFEVQSVVFKDGILSIALKDMEEPPKEELLEITQG